MIHRRNGMLSGEDLGEPARIYRNGTNRFPVILLSKRQWGEQSISRCLDLNQRDADGDQQPLRKICMHKLTRPKMEPILKKLQAPESYRLLNYLHPLWVILPLRQAQNDEAIAVASMN